MKSKPREEDKIAIELETTGTLSPSIHSLKKALRKIQQQRRQKHEEIVQPNR